MKNWRIAIILILILLFTANYKIGLVFSQDGPKKELPPEAAKAEAEVKGGEAKKKEEKPAAEEGKKEEKGKEKEEVKKTITAPAPVLEIKRLEAEQPLYSIELRDVELVDLFRVVAHDYNFNILVDKEVSGKITASFTSITLEEAMDGIAEISNLILQKEGSMIKVSPNLITKTFVLKYIEAKKLFIQTTTGTGTKQTSIIYDLLSDKGKVLLGTQPNSIMVIDYPSNIARVEEYLRVIDQRMASRVFKLKFLKASEIVGETSATTTSAAMPTAAPTTGAPTAGAGK